MGPDRLKLSRAQSQQGLSPGPLVFKDLKMRLKNGKEILKGISGRVDPGELLAVMGKSSPLKVAKTLALIVARDVRSVRSRQIDPLGCSRGPSGSRGRRRHRKSSSSTAPDQL